ncbi:unnamed protein product [Urochloa humidicola]
MVTDGQSVHIGLSVYLCAASDCPSVYLYTDWSYTDCSCPSVYVYTDGPPVATFTYTHWPAVAVVGLWCSASWKTRVQVLLGVARAIKHLHCHAMPLVIHGNVASSNVLLDAAWAPRLSGFGASMWRAAGVPSQPAEVAGAASCGGYADPEYFSTGHIKPASDVYGLGVVMLEVLTGQPPVVSVWDEVKQDVVAMTLASFALPSIQAGRLGDVLDRRPAPQPTTWQLTQPLLLVANMAARCLHLHGDNRPAISDVVANLEQALYLI